MVDGERRGRKPGFPIMDVGDDGNKVDGQCPPYIDF
jgi:hypothetical protein